MNIKFVRCKVLKWMHSKASGYLLRQGIYHSNLDACADVWNANTNYNSYNNNNDLYVYSNVV